MTDSDNDFGDRFQTPLERAVEDNEGVQNLDKSETIYYLDAVFRDSMPEGHPDDHNGNATRAMLKDVAAVVAENREEIEAMSEEVLADE